MWWMLPLGMSVMSGMSKAKQAQSDNDINVVRAGTGRDYAAPVQTNPWESLSAGAMGALGANQEMAMNDAYLNYLKANTPAPQQQDVVIPEYSQQLNLDAPMEDGSTWSVMGRKAGKKPQYSVMGNGGHYGLGD